MRSHRGRRETIFPALEERRGWLQAFPRETRNVMQVLDISSSLIFPTFNTVSNQLAPWTEAALRLYAGLAFVPHSLRAGCGYFSGANAGPHGMSSFARQLDRGGYRPGWLWAPAIILTQLVGGPLLAVGLFTQIAAFPIFVFLAVCNFQRWKVGGFFWDNKGAEYTLLWTLVVLVFLMEGGGPISADHFLRTIF
jgi:putative oxidoreductase